MSNKKNSAISPSQPVGLCKENKPFRSILNFGDSRKVMIWFREKAEFRVRCSFWCENQPNLMHMNSAQADSNALLEKVVSVGGIRQS